MASMPQNELCPRQRSAGRQGARVRADASTLNRPRLNASGAPRCMRRPSQSPSQREIRVLLTSTGRRRVGAIKNTTNSQIHFQLEVGVHHLLFGLPALLLPATPRQDPLSALPERPAPCGNENTSSTVVHSDWEPRGSRLPEYRSPAISLRAPPNGRS